MSVAIGGTWGRLPGGVEATARLAALHEYGVLDAPADDELTAVVRTAAAVAGVPTASLNLLDEHRQCQLTTVGFDGADSPRRDSMCDVVVAERRVVHVGDARQDARFADNPWVTGVLADVRLYVSVPLITPEGHVLGTLCVFDSEPGELSAAQLATLQDLAGVVLALFERRRQARQNAELAAEALRQRKLAEAYARELRVRQEFIEAVNEAIEIAIVACDENGHLTLFNRAAREWHGLEPDTSLDPVQWSRQYGLYAADGVTPLAQDQVPLFRALNEGHVENVEMVIRGDEHHPAMRVLCTGRAMRAADGTLLGAVVAMSDVTAERTQRRALAEREQLLTTILETAPDAFVVTDSAGAITAWNPAAESMFGWTEAQAYGRTLGELIIPGHVADARLRDLTRRAATGEPRRAGEHVQVPAHRRDGTELLVELSLAEFTWRGEKRFHAFLRDVTEREAARERLALANSELAAANDELDRFTAIVAHDLKSPLTAIVGYADVLAETVGAGAEGIEVKAVGAITRAASRMGTMIDDLLAYAHACHEPLRLEPVDLGAVVDDLAGEARAGAAGEVVITHDPLPVPSAHPTLLRLVLANLVGNAVKYVAPGVTPRVHVGAEWADGEVTIRVTDNGIGIDPNSRERVFAMFHRERTPESYQGTGIGLSTCRRVVERHGGRIWIEPGRRAGTSICFTLPCETAPGLARRTAS
ncbi:PAS domain S-box protein [Actinokineospora auranticolor]|uniref:Sensor-like histidine kinase SenX3 n=1 Tax=Actinokineospora auranticolor TaxID=155976 RepID=A0A2S6GC66_9PSEU|nr:PAS domain S-box protein [Actinokineospora auranticolor]PPK62069.1 PAS domain S-box-containing protein [Actinokineospora auranticolor]